jgi:hypothetical protein
MPVLGLPLPSTVRNDPHRGLGRERQIASFVLDLLLSSCGHTPRLPAHFRSCTTVTISVAG